MIHESRFVILFKIQDPVQIFHPLMSLNLPVYIAFSNSSLTPFLSLLRFLFSPRSPNYTCDNEADPPLVTEDFFLVFFPRRELIRKAKTNVTIPIAPYN